MVFYYKKEYKDLYFPKKKPELITVPEMNYLAVSGSGDPNKEDKKGEHKIPGYFDFVVPPLEGLWWMKGDSKIDYSHKENIYPTLLLLKSWIGQLKSLVKRIKKISRK